MMEAHDAFMLVYLIWFLFSLQILGLVFSMTMFCQSVKVETFYA